MVDTSYLNNLTNDQRLAVKKMTLWYSLSDNQQYFRLVGFAGTGKTFIIKYFINEIGLTEDEVAYCAFTGSAAMNLVKKGNKQATTIHQLVYNTTVEEFPIYKKKKNPKTGEMELTDEVIDYKKVFKTEPKVELSNPNVKLIVLDEFSMANDEMIKTILKFGRKVLMVGDSGQLEPINSSNSYVSEYDSQLEEIVRQGEDSPIIDLSFKARNGIAIPYSLSDPKALVIPDRYLDNEEDSLKYYTWATQILCGTNRTRKNVNNLMRKHLGRKSKLPEVGDKIVCTQNNWRLQAFSPKLNAFISLVNGTLGYVKKVKAISTGTKEMIIDFVVDFDPQCIFEDIKISFYNFDEEAKKPFNKYKTGKEVINEFDFGYCMTVHKAQGNGYKKCLVIVEKMSYKPFELDKEKRWLYTAITRAENKLILVIDDKYYNWYKKYYTFDNDYYDTMEEFFNNEDYSDEEEDYDDYVNPNTSSAGDFDFVE